MAIRFAGSRSVDERRRRRLAQEADAAPRAESPRRFSRSAAASREDDDGRLPRGSSPADTLISPKLWKHVLVAIACVLSWGAMLGLGDIADQRQEDLAEIVGLEAGHLPRFFSTVMLLTAGQLAFINLWYRSRSRKDFNGSYKVWFYTAVGWLALCAFTATGSHWTLADAVLAGRPMTVWNGRMMLWMIPGAIIVVALYRLLLREVRDCRGSQWLLRASACAAGASALLTLLGSYFFATRAQLLLETGAATLWHLLLALAMLCHARHVIHVCNEPPRSPMTAWSQRLPRIRWRLSGLRRRPSGPKSAAKPRRTSAASKSKGTTTRRPRKSTKAQASANSDEQIEQELEDERLSEATGVESAESTSFARVSGVSRSETGQRRRVDAPQSVARGPHIPAGQSEEDEEESLDAAGLSRKERRRMRQQQKQGQRR